MQPKPKTPPPVGEVTYFIDTGPQPVPPSASRVKLVPVGDGTGPPFFFPPRQARRAVLPSPDELAALPAAAREAFLQRCLARLPADHPPPADPVAAAAVAILSRPAFPKAVLAIRRDFERVRRRAKYEGWTDDTPVPPDTFGRL